MVQVQLSACDSSNVYETEKDGTEAALYKCDRDSFVTEFLIGSPVTLLTHRAQ